METLDKIIDQLVVQQEEGEITKGDLNFLVREAQKGLFKELKALGFDSVELEIRLEERGIL